MNLENASEENTQALELDTIHIIHMRKEQMAALFLYKSSVLLHEPLTNG